jgi:hypothetical protein
MNDKMENLYLRFTVHITNKEYSYGPDAKQGEASLSFSVPRPILGSLAPGNVFDLCLAAALQEYDKPKEVEPS